MLMGMGRNPNRPVNIPIPTEIDSKMGGALHLPQNGIPLVLTHGHISSRQVLRTWTRGEAQT